MDRHTNATRELQDDLRDLHQAEAALATLHAGSRDYLLMSEVVDRLSAALDWTVRSRARRAALRDAAVLASTRTDVYESAYEGPARPEYRRLLAGYLSTLDGSLEDGPGGLVAIFKGQRIRIHFGSTRGASGWLQQPDEQERENAGHERSPSRNQD